MESFSLRNKNVKCLLCIIDVFTKVNESNRKPNKLWVDQAGEFYNKLMQEWLENNEGKSVIAESF